MWKALLAFLFAPQRTGCQCWCPNCRNELTSGPSAYREDQYGNICYTCSECGTMTRWDFDAPVPLLIETIR